MAAQKSVSSQNVIKSRVLDGDLEDDPILVRRNCSRARSWKSYHLRRPLRTRGCSKQENLTWKVDDKSFSQISSSPDILFGSSGIWEIQSLIPTAVNSDHILKQKLKLNYLKFRA